MKGAVLNLMRITGAFAPFRLANRNKALILTYHRFSSQEGALATSARAFAEQLNYLRSRYRIVSLSELAGYLASGERFPPALVAITIDDGYRDAYEIAYPLLRAHDTPATLFVVSGFVDGKTWIWTDKLRFITLRTNEKSVEVNLASNRFRLELDGEHSRLKAADTINSALKSLSIEDRDDAIARMARELSVIVPDAPPAVFAPVNLEQVREMDSNRIEIGSHTDTHPVLTRVSRDRLRREIHGSRLRLEAELGRKVELFCYPNGDFDPYVQSEVALAGYRCAVTTGMGMNDAGSDLLALKRIHTERDLSHFAQATSGLEQLKARLRRTVPRPAGAHF
jgi:peptidoglycan/xylan/chitin deacetylase (PgdA/CDA1 family)